MYNLIRLIGFVFLNFRMASLVPGVLITTLIIVLCDSLYFGELTFKKLWHLTMDWNDWKVTPFQFVMYNVVPGNLDQHGSHPLWLHSLVNLQILYGPLGNEVYKEYLPNLLVSTLLVKIFVF